MSKKKKGATRREKILAKTRGCCVYCGRGLQADLWHIEHMLPKNRGGSGRLENLWPACPSCNAKKGDKTVEEYRLYLKQHMIFDVAQCEFTAKQYYSSSDHPALFHAIDTLKSMLLFHLPPVRFYFERLADVGESE